MKLVSPPPDERALVLNWLAQRIAVGKVETAPLTRRHIGHRPLRLLVGHSAPTQGRSARRTARDPAILAGYMVNETLSRTFIGRLHRLDQSLWCGAT